MEIIPLGKSVLRSSRLGFGCWRLAGTWDSCEVTPERIAHGQRAVIAAYEAGYTFFDHADIYCAGEAETIFGLALKQVSGMRDQIVIASKCGIRKSGEPSADAPYRYDFSAEHIIRSCDESLRRLGVETLDLYQLHRPDFLMDPDEVADAFSRLRKEGKVREFGVSNFNPSQVELLQHATAHFLMVNQVEISLARLNCFFDGTLDQCLIKKMTPIAWSPLGGGRLGSDDPIDLRDADHAHRIKVRETLDIIARRHEASRAAIAIAWLLKHPAKIVPLIGSTNPDKIKKLTEATQIHLTREEWYTLFEAAHGSRLA